MTSDVYRCAPVVRELWFWLLMRVNWADSDKCKRGQWIGTIDDIRDELSWYSGFRKESYSKSQIVRAYGKLTEMRMVETMAESNGIRLSICNYARYQGSKSTGETVVDNVAKRSRNAEGSPYYNNNNNKHIITNIKQEEEEEKEIPYSSNKAMKILRLVEPVFGDLCDPLAGLGGISNWGHIVFKAINTYSEQAVVDACNTLVDLTKKGEANYNNPKVFFDSGLPGYIVKSRKMVQKIKEKEWTGYCVECDHSKTFKTNPGTSVLCDNCGDDHLKEEWLYRHEKDIKNPKPKPEEPIEVLSDEDQEHKNIVEGFLKNFG